MLAFGFAFEIISRKDKWEAILRFLAVMFGSYATLTLIGRALVRYMIIRRNDSKIGWKCALDINYSKKIPKYYHIFAKSRKVFMLTTIYWSIQSIFGLISVILYGYDAMLFWASIIIYLYIIKYIVLIYCVYNKQSRNFNDYWGLSIELKRIVSISLAFSFLNIMAYIVVEGISMPDYITTETLHCFNIYIWHHVMLYVTIDWVICKNGDKRKQNSNSSSNSPQTDRLGQCLQTEIGMQGVQLCVLFLDVYTVNLHVLNCCLCLLLQFRIRKVYASFRKRA